MGVLNLGGRTAGAELEMYLFELTKVHPAWAEPCEQGKRAAEGSQGGQSKERKQTVADMLTKLSGVLLDDCLPMYDVCDTVSGRYNDGVE